MRKIFTLLTCIAFSSYALSQVTPEIQWAKTYGGSEADAPEKIIQTADGGYAFIGYAISNDGDVTENKGQADYWLVKTNATGTIEWQKTFGGTTSDTGSALKQTPDGGFIIGGSTYSDDGDISENNSEPGLGQDFWILKISSTGEVEWKNNYGGNYEEILKDLQLTSDGGYIAVGTTASKSGDVSGGYGIEGNFFQEGWVVKIDSQGVMEWQRPYGGYEGFVEFSNIQQTTDGGYIIGGYAGYGFDGDFPEPNGNIDFWALKINATGDIEWSKVFGGSRDDYGQKISQTLDGGYIIVGGVYSNDGDVTGGYGNGNTDLWVLKLDSQGELEWKKLIGGTGAEGGSVAYETPDHHFVIGGGTSSSDGDFAGFPNNGNLNHFLIKLNGANGSIIWTKTMGGSAMDVFFDFQLTAEGGFITVGSSFSNDGNVSGNHGSADIWVVKLSPDCLVPELNVATTHTICAGEALTLTAGVVAETVNWYAAANAETPIFTGAVFEVPELAETTSFWVEASNYICKTSRTEVVVTVNPLPVLTIQETEVVICSGSEASLYASSPGHVIFWYANQTDTQYLYHGNLFVTEVLTENTTYWVEAYNLTTGCRSERIEVAIAVGETLLAPTAASPQELESGLTLADLIVTHAGTLTWYANESLTTELPETTVAVDGTTYYVIQSAGACASSSTAILVNTTLGTGDFDTNKFAYYPNPVTAVLNFRGNESVKGVQVYDLTGKLILDQNSGSILNINLSALPKATYVVKATTDKGINVFKIVKN